MSDDPKKAKVVGRPFAEGNSGRPVGARNRLGRAFIEALFADFEKHGVSAIEKVREIDPSTYVRTIASILPKELTGVDGEGSPVVEITYRWAEPREPE